MRELRRCPHNDDYECASCFDARHAVNHATYVDGCATCKLSTLRMYGRFTGPASCSDAVQTFWRTGDPAVFDAQDRAAAGARQERKTSIG